jgi:hypothetical protein
VLACAKHFPGHGRTAEDSNLVRPIVDHADTALRETDLVPFVAAVRAGVASVMVAHVAYPSLDPSGEAASLSVPIITELLRGELAFDGLVVSDAFGMGGIRVGATEAENAVRAIAAGCDLLLAPEDLDAACAALDAALDDGTIAVAALERSLRRRRKWAQWATPPSDFLRPAAADIAWGGMLADRVLHMVRGTPRSIRAPLEIVVVEDDAPPGAGQHEPLFAALRAAGVPAREVQRPVPGARGSVIIALFGETQARKGRCEYAPATLQAVQDAITAAVAANREPLIVQFAHPRISETLPGTTPVLCAWGGERAMQEAAARWLASRRAGVTPPAVPTT